MTNLVCYMSSQVLLTPEAHHPLPLLVGLDHILLRALEDMDHHLHPHHHLVLHHLHGKVSTNTSVQNFV